MTHLICNCGSSWFSSFPSLGSPRPGLSSQTREPRSRGLGDGPSANRSRLSSGCQMQFAGAGGKGVVATAIGLDLWTLTFWLKSSWVFKTNPPESGKPTFCTKAAPLAHLSWRDKSRGWLGSEGQCHVGCLFGVFQVAGGKF